ncbi:alpha/beta hydrolase [uncultured Tateyamaria sp.]|uniref:alpha/beta fold hydrolase n=1 Tax=uncultured Tateyamaria sp. TaxID=455651 RepID=UPI002609C722|nr:alpha/beta hydrolase [uncultured Tateyamaria sp.]
MRAALLLVLSFVLSGCVAPIDPSSDETPIVFDAQAVASARSVVIATPGALTSISVLRDLDRFASPDRAVVYYRLPGLDGRARSGRVDIERAATTLTDFVAHHEFEQVYFVGFSTGNAINLEAAKILAVSQSDVRSTIAGISTALPAPQPTLAGVRGFAGNVAAAARVGSLNRRDIWLEYYKTLLFGPPDGQPATVRKSAETLTAANAPRIVVPDAALARSHASALIGWTNSEPERLKDIDIVLFHGARDPVFPLRAVVRFAEGLPRPATVVSYDNNGHLLLITQPRIFDHMFAFFEQVAP